MTTAAAARKIAEDLIALAAKATPGPWVRSGVRQKLPGVDCIMVGPDGFLIFAVPIGARPKEHAGAFCDAGFVAAANPKAITALAQAYLSHSRPQAGTLTEAEQKTFDAAKEVLQMPFCSINGKFLADILAMVTRLTTPPATEEDA